MSDDFIEYDQPDPDELRDIAIDEMMSCSSQEEADKLREQYPTLTKHLPIDFQRKPIKEFK